MNKTVIRRLFYILALALALVSCAEEFDDTSQAGKDFLEANKANSDVCVTASGLQYKVIKDNPYGIYPRIITGYIKLNLTGYFLDGTVYESGEGKTYLYSSLISGLKEAVRRMKIGSKWRVWIPSGLAFGSDGVTDSSGAYLVDPNTTMIYDVELLEEY